MKRIFLILVVLICVLYNTGCTNINEKEYTDDEIIRHLGMSVQEILDLTNEDIDELSSVVVFEPDVFFPCIDMASFRIVCRSSDMADLPIYIAMDQDDVEKYLKMLQLDRSMDFQDIMEVMGTAAVEESKEGAGYKRYRISFVSGELEYYFCSDNPDGEWFELYIGLAEGK